MEEWARVGSRRVRKAGVDKQINVRAGRSAVVSSRPLANQSTPLKPPHYSHSLNPNLRFCNLIPGVALSPSLPLPPNPIPPPLVPLTAKAYRMILRKRVSSGW